MEKDILRARIQERLSATGKSAHAVSREIKAGLGYVRDLLDPDKGGFPRADKLNALARALDTTTDYLTGETSIARPVLSEVSFADRRLNWRGPPSDLPPIPLVGTGDCATIEFKDESGHMLEVERCSFDSDHTVRMIARPPALEGARDLYAIYFHGESMMPRYEPGEVGIVDPTRPPGPGDYVLVQINSGEDDHVTSVLVKRLVRANTRELVLEQFNPAATFSVPRARVVRFHRILQQTDLLFG
ncbi:S24 family peptidase [Erythrobacter sp. NFXS35]|uniref:S24 family peptidase n=1 Tax=Erythrobacter sp. NFXS35 TaxID=2818436 RepID=UPI0032E016E5